jgi:hypothetical protein
MRMNVSVRKKYNSFKPNTPPPSGLNAFISDPRISSIFETNMSALILGKKKNFFEPNQNFFLESVIPVHQYCSTVAML